MQIELIILEKRTGRSWDASSCVSTVTYTTERTGTPGKLTFTLIKSGDISFVEGDSVTFSVDGKLVFFGYVFTKSKDRWGVIDVTCYDRIRYLKTNASYRFYGQTATQILKQIAEDFQLPLADVEDTGYKIPSLLEDDKGCIDILQDAIHQTLLNTGKLFVLFDNGKGLSLKEAGEMRAKIILGDKSLVTDYTYKTDIDQNTYNSIKLVRPNEKTGKADVVEVFDSDTEKNWGTLRLYKTVDGDMNTAQMETQAKQMLSFYNRRLKTFRVESLGVQGIRAGMFVYMNIQGLGDINLSQYVMIEKISHTYENDKHIMSFDTWDLDEWNDYTKKI